MNSDWLFGVIALKGNQWELSKQPILATENGSCLTVLKCAASQIRV